MTDKHDKENDRQKRSEADDVKKPAKDSEGSPPPKRKFRGNDRDQ